MKSVVDEPRMAYANYLKFAVEYDTCKHTFSYRHNVYGVFIRNAKVTGVTDENSHDFHPIEEFKNVKAKWEQPLHGADTRLSIHYSGAAGLQQDITIQYMINRDGIQCDIECEDNLIPNICGEFIWGQDMAKSTYAVCIDRPSPDIRSAYGPASSSIDNALFNRKTGSAVVVTNVSKLSLQFDWNKNAYYFEVHGKRFNVSIYEQIFERMFKTPYKPINKNNTFPKPPVGWMTWYAVKFDASEKTVLDNAKWLKKNLADFGADTIWVDWEWYHSVPHRPGPVGIDFFHPDKERYPNGLTYLSNEIKKLGLIPAIWIGPTNEPASNKFILENEDTILVQKASWCGEYFFDISNPKILNQYIPNALKKILEWGFSALKWDCLPITLAYTDQYHEWMMSPNKTSEEALRELIKKAREVVGDNFYMLSCAGGADREILMAIDLFDAARIGGDIFKWEEFINDFIARIMRFYSYHNIEIYCDPDNLVIRPEFNTYDQAVSRVSFVSVLGLPITLGDNMPELPADRVELLKRCIPTLDIHPMDIREIDCKQNIVIVNLSINLPFEQWNVVCVLNLLETDTTVLLSIQNDFHLTEEAYLLYDYWNKEYLGEIRDSVNLHLRSCASKILSVRKASTHPQIVSTSRHISQGAVDLIDVVWNEPSKTLSGISRVISGDPYTITIRNPDGDKLESKTYIPKETCNYKWSFTF